MTMPCCAAPWLCAARRPGCACCTPADAGRGLAPEQYPLPEPGAAERVLVDHVSGRVAGRLAALGLPPLAAEVRFGKPAKVARSLAREWGADLIVTSRPACYDFNRSWGLAALPSAAFASAAPGAGPAARLGRPHRGRSRPAARPLAARTAAPADGLRRQPPAPRDPAQNQERRGAFLMIP